MTYTVAFNQNKSTYEVHAEGCRHITVNAALEPMGTSEADTGAEVAAQFAQRNEGCSAKLGPCAR